MKYTVCRLFALILLVASMSAWAYDYTFHNRTNNDVEVKWHLIWGSDKSVTVPKGGSTKVEVGGIQIGLCMSTDPDSLSARKLPAGKAVYPLIISRRSPAYAELIRDGKITTSDFGVVRCNNYANIVDAAHKCNPKYMMCFNLEFDIYEVEDKYFVFVFQ